MKCFRSRNEILTHVYPAACDTVGQSSITRKTKSHKYLCTICSKFLVQILPESAPSGRNEGVDILMKLHLFTMKCQSLRAARVILIITKGQQREINAQQSLIPKTTVHLPPRTNCQITARVNKVKLQPLQGQRFAIEEEVLDPPLGCVIQKKMNWGRQCGGVYRGLRCVVSLSIQLVENGNKKQHLLGKVRD